MKLIEEEVSSQIALMDYFPLYMLFAKEEPDLLHHYNIIKRPTGCFEFACDYETNRLLRISLVLAGSYSIIHKSLTLDDCPLGSFTLDLPAITETEVFQSIIYDDGVEVVLSDKEPVTFLGSGDMRIGLSASGDIVRVFALNMSTEEIAHTKEEIEAIANEDQISR